AGGTRRQAAPEVGSRRWLAGHIAADRRSEGHSCVRPARANFQPWHLTGSRGDREPSHVESKTRAATAGQPFYGNFAPGPTIGRARKRPRVLQPEASFVAKRIDKNLTLKAINTESTRREGRLTVLL